eukprot:1409361-Alexandrium_andersonii.AAC.1
MLSLAGQLSREGHRVVILNTANRDRPGSGVEAGHAPQEADIHRRSDLFRFLEQQCWEEGLYPIPDRSALLSRD